MLQARQVGVLYGLLEGRLGTFWVAVFHVVDDPGWKLRWEMAGFCRTGTDTVLRSCKQFMITLEGGWLFLHFHFSLTWLLLYLFLPLDRVLQMCHQTHVGTVIGLHQVSQHREEAGRNAVRRLKSRSQHYSSDRCRKMRCYFYLTKSGVGVL